MIQENRYIKLSDVSETGETWDKLKASSITVGEILKSSANLSFQRRGVRIAGGLYLRNQRNKDGKFHPMAVWDETAGCSSFLKGVFTKPLEEKGRRFRTTEVYRCNDRLCPICQKVKSIRLTFKALQRMSYIEAKEQLLPPAQRHKYIFLTLTVENCAVVNLRETILMMNKAFRRLQSYPFWKKYVAGYIRKMEVTRNHKDGTAHPHFHVLFMVTPDYFDHQKPQVSQDEYCLIWQQAMELNYKPICDVRLVKPNWKKGKIPSDRLWMNC